MRIHKAEILRLINDYWPPNDMSHSSETFHQRMRFIQREMIAIHYESMDEATKERALATMRWLEAKGV